MSILETIDTPVGGYAPDFELPGIDGQVHHLSRYLEKYQAVTVISMYNRCPYVGLYLERLKKIQADFLDNGFTLIGMNGNSAHQSCADSFDTMKVFAQQHQLNFPYLWDSTQDVTRSFGAIKTPMAFLIDNDGVVRYKGQIDDNSQNHSLVHNDYLRNAIASLLNNEEIRIKQTEAIGSSLVLRN